MNNIVTYLISSTFLCFGFYTLGKVNGEKSAWKRIEKRLQAGFLDNFRTWKRNERHLQADQEERKI